jgi:hypothetical protein
MADQNSSFTAAKGLIFRITHRDNLAWILDHGLHCANTGRLDPNFVSIGHPEIIDRRRTERVPIPPGGALADYVPFYFTPYSPMLLNIITGRGVKKRRKEEIVVLVSSIPKLMAAGIGFVFTSRHALSAMGSFYSDPQELEQIDWAILNARDFRRDENDLGKIDRYQAEVLVHHRLPVSALLGIGCYDSATERQVAQSLEQRGLRLMLTVRPRWYFE